MVGKENCELVEKSVDPTDTTATGSIHCTGCISKFVLYVIVHPVVETAIIRYLLGR